MADESFDYPRLVEDALRTVVRDVLRKAGREGISDPHHFYISFRTDFPGVDVHDDIRAHFPSEMSIILQHQYWDLDAGDDGFSVHLSFSGVARRLYVPYQALTVFSDPGVDFGLRFTPSENDDAMAEDAGASTIDVTDPPASDGSDTAGSADIVALDRFRKK